MRTRIVIVGGILSLSLGLASCTKPAPASNANASASPAAKSSPGAGTKKTIPTSKTVAIPADWEPYIDNQKGYGFKLPVGSQTHSDTTNGMDVFVAKVPEPGKVQVMVFAFKEKSFGKDELMTMAKDTLTNMGEKDVKIGARTALSDDYDIAEISSTDDKGVVTKGKVLLATDVTDNYIVFLGSPEADYAANEKLIDEIWGSFAMASGGFSGNS